MSPSFSSNPQPADFFQRNSTLLIAVALAALAIFGRFLSVGEFGNFTPVGAVALFAGCYLRDRKLAILVPFAALLLSDAVLGFHSLMPVVYACFALTTWLGMQLRTRISGLRVLGFALSGSLCFFILTNFAVWATSGMYPLTGAGLAQCFTMALPFFRNDLMGTLFYSGLLFGGLQLLQARAHTHDLNLAR